MTSLYSLSLLLHLVAVALWLGGIAFFLVVFAPAAHDLEPAISLRALNRGRTALETMAWAAIGILLLTGIGNLIVSSRATGAPMPVFYTVVLSIKLFLFFAMVVHHCLQVFKYGGKIAVLTAELPPQTTSWPEPLLTHWRKWFLLLKVNAGLGPVAILLGMMLAGR